ncbi:hypothetical protein F4818DRAFT_411322 [Hypoxylon cercidicola]|nr:hypothetical protein F4818DRAFT_411322 [Hypoxylon cercidicola]
MSPALVLLRVLPVMVTSSTLTFTFCEDLFLRPHTRLSGTARDHVNGVLPPYVKRWFPRGFAYVLVLYPATWALGIANLAVRTVSMHPYSQHSSTANLAAARASWGLYAAGLIFSMAHFAWGLKARGLMDTVAGNGSAAVVHNANSGKDGNNAISGNEVSREEALDGINDSIPTLRAWLRLNAIRGISVDVPAWACFFVGFLLSVGY